MKTLYLLRHAKSCWKDTHLTDHQRPLNKRGKRQIQWLGESPFVAVLENVRLFCSDAVRAHETLQGLMQHAQIHAGVVVDPKLYTFAPLELVHWLKARPESSDVLIVGHNPALIGLIDYLAPDQIEGFPTAAWIELRLNISRWSQLTPFCGDVARYVTPVMLNHDAFLRKHEGSKQSDNSLEQWLMMLELYRQPAMLGQDPEFLHQFRIYARKLKGALSLHQMLANAEAQNQQVAREHLKRLIALSNPVRDLDVFDDYLEGCKSRLGNEFLGGLLSLQSMVADERQGHYRALTRFLDSQDYSHGHQVLVACLTNMSAPIKVGGELRQHHLREVVVRRHKKLKKRLGQLNSDCDDAAFHHVRLQLKNLINSQDLGNTLKPTTMKKLVQLKKQLGGLQDACVQQQHLLQYAVAAPGDDALLHVVEVLLHNIRGQKEQLKARICNA
ncbi:Uncharacterised protein [BD1-7 clade bacterium]|uniref:CHAD domain-containing protein n=1 Tax=BD1-7 clade bacterium TaxID=2029982 RepID=A0A5S9NVJ8_9GAMM|nr:Uncharacterised protein [BD1-7 clade bacterium]CAA0095467.1 Uncharacterised protein [BD1-7 clade bacterium]